MYLEHFIKQTLGDVLVDPERTLLFGGLELGVEAAAEAARLIENPTTAHSYCTVRPRVFDKPVYWQILNVDSIEIEFFGLPLNYQERLPTAIEIALVRAVASAGPEDHSKIISGNYEIILSNISLPPNVFDIIPTKAPLVGESILYDKNAALFDFKENYTDISKLAQKCWVNSFNTSPLKFRFIEIYRVIEATFIAEIKRRLIGSFDQQPLRAVEDARSELGSELNQIVAIAREYPYHFERCHASLLAMKNTNRFISAIFRNVDKKNKINRSIKHEYAAALIYQIRCSIVHAGEKDIIFESFNDADDALMAIFDSIENIALALLGLEV